MAGWSNRRQAVIWFSLLVVAGSLALIVTHSRAAIGLVYFRAVSRDQAVELLWETATEVDNAGFFITRSDQNTGTYTQASEFIFSESPNGLNGATYVYTDTNLTNGVKYWYQLEAVDINQNTTFAGPVYSIPGENQATPEPTVPSTTTPLTPCASAVVLSGMIIVLRNIFISVTMRDDEDSREYNPAASCH